MPPDKAYHIAVARLPADLPVIHDIRRTVFIEEQQIPGDLEWDGLDGVCRHVLAFSGSGTVVGTGRLQSDGRIGRMAVLPAWRGRGAGSAILDKLTELAHRDGRRRVTLHAQLAVAGFYRKAGFIETGAVFMEAAIAHVPMEKILSINNN